MKYEIIIRPTIFLATFTVIAFFELKSPYRKLTTSKKLRWINNLAIIIGNSLLLRLVFPFLAVGMAVIAHERSWGLLNILDWPYWLEIVAGIIFLDLVIYIQHVIIRETNSNFGFNLSWWDRLFGTYKAQPQKGHVGMTIGLSQFRDPQKLTLPWLLILPIIGDPGKQPINPH